MPAGTRRNLVSIYRPTVIGQNASGEDVVSNVLLGEAWVRIDALAGREAESARQLFAEARFRVTLDHPLSSMTIQRKDIILWGSPGRMLDILDVEDQTQRRRAVVLLAKDYTD
jgi:head-tail adaptor